MELTSAYLYVTTPVPTKNIHARSFHNLKRKDWYKDVRKSAKFEILNKRFQLSEQWYRVIIRFKNTEAGYELDTPMPFIVAETATSDGIVFKDTKVYHGRKMGNTIGFLENGIPAALIDCVVEDLENSLAYLDGTSLKRMRTKEDIDIDLD